MTSPHSPARRPRVWVWLLAVLAAVGLLAFGAGAASVHTLPDGGNRVRASAPETITAVGVSDHIATDQGRGPPGSQPQTAGAAGVAADTAVGFSEDAVGSAYQGMRSGGGHAIRHLRDEGLIPNTGSLSSQVSAFEDLTSPILASPSKTFDWTLGTTKTRAFAGTAGGKQVVIFVAKEGPYQGLP